MATKPKDSKDVSHPDAVYLKQNEIGGVIAKGMAVTFQADPKNPIDFFARWLLSQSEAARRELKAVEDAQAVKEMKEEHQKDLKIKQKELAVS